jgi:hypothetical protein
MGKDASQENNRRRFLAALGTAAIGSLAGCSGDDQTGNGEENTGNGVENGVNNSEPSNDNGGDNGSENGTPQNGQDNGGENGPDDETGTGGNGQQNGGENGQENGTENGGENGQPDALLEAAKILDGENQELDSLTLGDGENATTNAEIYVDADAETQTSYTAEITYTGEEPGIAEEIEQIFDLEGEIQNGEQATLIGEINYEQLKQQIDEEINAEIQVTVEAEQTGEQETVKLPITLKEQNIDPEALRQRNLQNRQNFLRFVPQIQGKYEIYFEDIETMKAIADKHGVETTPEADTFYDFLHQQDESLEGLNYSDVIVSGLFTIQDPENPDELVSVQTYIFEPEIDSFETVDEGGYQAAYLLSHEDYPHQLSLIGGTDFPEVFIDVLENEHPDLSQEIEDDNSEYRFMQTDAYQDGIVFNWGNSTRINSLFSQKTVEPSDINAFRYHPQDGTVTDEHWEWKEGSQEYVLSTQLERDDVGNTLYPLTPQI